MLDDVPRLLMMKIMKTGRTVAEGPRTSFLYNIQEGQPTGSIE